MGSTNNKNIYLLACEVAKSHPGAVYTLLTCTESLLLTIQYMYLNKFSKIILKQNLNTAIGGHSTCSTNLY